MSKLWKFMGILSSLAMLCIHLVSTVNLKLAPPTEHHDGVMLDITAVCYNNDSCFSLIITGDKEWDLIGSTAGFLVDSSLKSQQGSSRVLVTFTHINWVIFLM